MNAWIVSDFDIVLDWLAASSNRRGPAAAKHRSPKMLDVRRVTQLVVSADRSRRTLTSATSWWCDVIFARSPQCQSFVDDTDSYRTQLGLACDQQRRDNRVDPWTVIGCIRGPNLGLDPSKFPLISADTSALANSRRITAFVGGHGTQLHTVCGEVRANYSTQ